MKAHALLPALVFFLFGVGVLSTAALTKRARLAAPAPATAVSARAR